MAVVLKDVSPNNNFRPIREIIRPELPQYIIIYVASGKKLRIDPNTIVEIVEKFTKAGDGSDLHRVSLTNRNEIIVNDAGLVELDVVSS